MSKKSTPFQPSRFRTDQEKQSDQVPQSSLASAVWPLTWRNGLAFVLLTWLLSRLVIVLALQVLAPRLHLQPFVHELPIPLGSVPNFVPTPGWELFTHWDGKWYEKIATQGYEHGNDPTKQYTISFLPLYALVCHLVMRLGLPFKIAGTLVNNVAFLSALVFFHAWVQEHYSPRIARWSTAVLAWFPFALFGTVAYTEGLFLLSSTAALRAFDQRQYVWSVIWGSVASATRIFSLALLPTFLLVAWKEKRSPIAYAASFGVLGGMVLFMIYCGWRFNDPLILWHAQGPWAEIKTTFPKLLGQLSQNMLRFNLLSRAVIFLGGLFLLLSMRKWLHFTAAVYGFCSIGLLLAANNMDGIARYTYGIVSVAIALGILLSQHWRWGVATLGIFAIGLGIVTVRFGWWYFVA
jgi:Mannosyltransferase (PIG-V)